MNDSLKKKKRLAALTAETVSFLGNLSQIINFFSGYKPVSHRMHFRINLRRERG